MDYEFKYDLIGQHKAFFSMGHEAFGHWMTDELGSNHSRIDQLFTVMEQLQRHKRWEFELPGSEYHLTLTRDDAEVRASALGMSTDDEAPEEMAFYDDESQATCGLDDFKNALDSWRTFISS